MQKNSLEWYSEPRIVYCEVDGFVAIDDVMVWNEQLKSFLEDGHPPIHVIINQSKQTGIESNIKQFEGNLSSFSHPNLGWVITYGSDNRLLSMMMAIATQKNQTRYRQLKSFEEGIAFLQNADATLPTE